MEQVADWFAVNGFQALQGAGILGGLLFTGFSLRQSARVQKAQFLINITQQHRTIWMEALKQPKLQRVLSESLPRNSKLTLDEKLFVNFVILHITSTLYSIRKGVLETPAGFDVDLKEFFSLPIPAAVWKEKKHLRDQQTILYIEALLGNREKK